VAAYNPDRDETVVVLANAMWTAGGNAPVAGIYETIRKALR
jgi:hypothetical protein